MLSDFKPSAIEEAKERLENDLTIAKHQQEFLKENQKVSKKLTFWQRVKKFFGVKR